MSTTTTPRTTTPLSITVPHPAPIMTGHLHLGEPAGTPGRLESTNRYLTRDGHPFIPVMGEFHYARSPRDTWEEEIAALKAGGITLIATYVFWILHEEHRGAFRWDGDRDLRHFIELCAAADLEVVIRIGPFGHGEARNGGFPDWLVEEFPTRGDADTAVAGPPGSGKARTDDPAYLAAIEPYLGQVAAQVAGLFHGDGGPIIGVQVENELYDQPGHLRTLRRTAERLGMKPAFWTATGWGGAHLPTDDVIPLYAGYADAFWEASDTGWPEYAPMHFLFADVRDDLSVGADVRAAAGKDTPIPDAGEQAGDAVDGVPDDSRVPYATCELGGGMHVAYHRRPLVDPVDVAALALTKLGSGSVWQGYYMYHGGSQVEIDNGYTQESHATGYPNDVPQVSYDFRAPLGEYGEVRDHFHRLRAQHLFIKAFGDQLATMPSVLPDVRLTSPTDRDTLRWAVRSDGTSGFLFVNDHQPTAAPLPDHDDVQFSVQLPDQTITVPSIPVTITSGTFFVWPLNLPVTPSITIRSATVQLLTRIEPIIPHGRPLLVVTAQAGIPVELDVVGTSAVRGPANVTARDGSSLVTLTVSPAETPLLHLDSDSGLDVLILDEATTNRAWVTSAGAREHLIITDADVLPWRNGLMLRTVEATPLTVWPADGFGPFEIEADGDAALELTHVDQDRLGTWTVQPSKGSPVDVTVTQMRAADAALLPPLSFGPLGRASAPTADAYQAAGIWSLSVDAEAVRTHHRLYLEIDWVGDVAQLLVDGHLIADRFYSGDPFSFELTRHADQLTGANFELRILPRREDAPVFLDPRARPTPDTPAGAVLGVTTRPVEAVILDPAVTA